LPSGRSGVPEPALVKGHRGKGLCRPHAFRARAAPRGPAAGRACRGPPLGPEPHFSPGCPARPRDRTFA
jgi:hypothetical protein